ncbi:MAG: divergent polysaccharide deacetylase family protein [Candidatus Eisenbacteria bacterium]|uniref:Divergent polysaccharide deacetylase family protein n=1 Tax=Eiseniibacteriota bacterium TaxID=2212470 RepID=A0A538THI7_UNCEI|nr:MAG: divergent polysaccharide deacetylase family protein [Candidatus Eisenbacteria bacterium]
MPSRWLWIAGAVLLITIVLLVGRRDRPSLFQPSKLDRSAGAQADSRRSDADRSATLVIDSDWDRLRLRISSEFLRVFRPGDRAALNRLTSRTLRGALEEIGISRELIDERPGTAAAAGVGRAPVQWKIQVPPRASLFRINDAVTQAILTLGGRVVRGVERPAQTAGVALDLRVGYGDRVTHAIVIEPNPAIADAGTQIAFIVLDLNQDSEPLFRAFLESPIPLTFALRPGQPRVSRTAKEIREADREVFVQLPMEPIGYPKVDPGKDAILLDLSRVEIEDRINRCLASVGSARGIITRMGGAAVNDPDVMRAVLGEVKRRDLLFVDAHGGGPTLVEEMGEEMGVKTLTLGGTLDISGANAAGIRARLRQLLTTAAQRGTLVVSFKASILTLGVIESERASLAEQGIEIVPASKLVL